ncbi:MAG: hypothetical protein GYB68_13740 [Chloroflexi bacterium]|nr:hypothetical protein [Chloroflexota bacterium]
MARRRKSSANSKSSSVKQPAKPREPWTPWGKWRKRRQEAKARREREREERRRQRELARMRRERRRRILTARGAVFIGLMGFACLIAFAILALLGRPFPWEALIDVAQVQQIDNLTQQTEERWDSLGISHYQLDVEYIDHNSDTHCGPVTIEVRDGEVVNDPGPDAGHWFPIAACEGILSEMTVEGAFTRVQRASNDYLPGTTRLRATFDTEFGYPTWAEAEVYDEEDRLDGCCWTFTWQNLQPID